MFDSEEGGGGDVSRKHQNDLGLYVYVGIYAYIYSSAVVYPYLRVGQL